MMIMASSMRKFQGKWQNKDWLMAFFGRLDQYDIELSINHQVQSAFPVGTL